MPRRIVSLVPSLSETLVELGLRNELVGCTQFCIEPPDLHRTAKVLGGTKDFSVEQILALKPTHILANQEENPKLPIEELSLHHKVSVTFPKGPEDAAPMLRQLGEYLDAKDLTEPWAIRIEKCLESLKLDPTAKRGRFVYMIWQKPYMLAGADTYISRLLSVAGFANAYEGSERYPSIEIEDLKKLRPEQIFLSTEPYPFRKRDAEALRRNWPEAPPIYRVDGRILSWYGTTTLKALELLGESSLALPQKLAQVLSDGAKEV